MFEHEKLKKKIKNMQKCFVLNPNKLNLYKVFVSYANRISIHLQKKNGNFFLNSKKMCKKYWLPLTFLFLKLQKKFEENFFFIRMKHSSVNVI